VRYTGYRIPTTAYMWMDQMFSSIEDGISRRGTTQSRLVFAVVEGGCTSA